MPSDHLMTASLAYRKNESAIMDGAPPEKYLRLLPYIAGDRILEMGSAEGVLSLLLAKEGRQVTALEMRRERHNAALALSAAWERLFYFPAPTFVCGRINEHLDLLDGIDTLVAVRMIYYLRDDLDTVFAEVSKYVPNVVLCGNRNRAQWWRDGAPNRNDRADNYYASHEGMADLLTRHGYRIETVIKEGDPIVVGSR